MIRTAIKWAPLLACMALAPALSAQSPTAAISGSGVPTGAEKPRIPGQNLAGMHVYLRAGLKTHMPGQHDYPQWLADWSKVLTMHGAVVDGSFHAPSAQELEGVDVLVVYKGDTGFMTPAERAALNDFVKRGGGIVAFHDAMCGPDPAEMAALLGGGKKHGEVNYTLDANVTYKIVDPASPIMKGMTNLTLNPEESFYRMTWASNPAIHVLATTVIDDTPSARQGGGVGQVVPQIWTYEHTVAGGKPARAFVWMQGHEYANFANPQIEAMLLRGIAWAGHHPVDELVDYKQPPTPERPKRN
ncbi:ThuA domain-containing protein [Sphingomonas crusticola]|uniref:ThuA domain-containing protein n=1 Tax=Sphingomonas crusticola TaxID=1697973 RepID=UPI0019683331|nr:ThuA domain-containing protein [Sphingomonas crusticola]